MQLQEYDVQCEPRRSSVRSGRRQCRSPHRSLWPIVAALVLLGVATVVWLSFDGDRERMPLAGDGESVPLASGGQIVGPPASEKEETALGQEDGGAVSIVIRDWIVQDLLPVNEWSRPGYALPQVNGVVVHYVGNPGTTAKQNRNYFAYLAETHETSASSHFIIGMDGEIIQCVPLDEIAYCSSERNVDTISIECCHPDDTGAFTQETLVSLTKLVDWLIETYGLEREDILRHYDVTGKQCPRYFYRHPEAWAAFLDGLTFPKG